MSVQILCRRHKISKSETKDFIAYSKRNIQSFMLLCVGSSCPANMAKMMQWAHDDSLRKWWPEKKHGASLPFIWGRHYPILQGCLLQTQFEKMASVKNGQVFAFMAYSVEPCRAYSRLPLNNPSLSPQ